jgi:hypothetical protein
VKECTECHITKPFDQFYRETKQASGLNPRCKICVNQRNRAYALANPERTREWSRRRSLRAYAKRYFNLDEAQYDALVARAGGKCEVCGREERTTSTNGHSFLLAIDHDHATLQIRGMLCRQCNTALGCVQDNPALLRKLADYLEHPLGSPVPSLESELQKVAHRERDIFGQTKRPTTGWNHSDDTRAKIATAALGRKSPFKGVPRPLEVIEKIRQGHIGKKRSDEARANMRAARLRYLGKLELPIP